MRIIANPGSRRGRGEKHAAAIAAALLERDISHTLHMTRRPLHAAELAREAVLAGEELVLCVGGDGTVSEAASGLCGSETALGIIPAGTGDDFARYLKLPKGPLNALDVALHGRCRTVDLGQANGRVFINAAGSGLDVAVLRHTLFYKRFFHGLPAYMLGVLRAVLSFRPALLELSYSGGEVSRKCLLVNVANGRYFGGGMMVAPEAEADDGLFDVHYVDELSRLKILFLLAGFVGGKYVRYRCTHHIRCDSLNVRFGDNSLQLDGEILSGGNVEYRLLRSALKVMVPAQP